VPFRISRLTCEAESYSIPSFLSLAALPAELVDVTISPWMVAGSLALSFTPSAFRQQLETVTNFFSPESFGASRAMEEVFGIQSPSLGLLLSGPTGCGRQTLLRHFVSARRLRFITFSVLEVIESSSTSKRFLGGVGLTEVIKSCLVTSEGANGASEAQQQPGNAVTAIIILTDLDSFTRLSSEVTDPGIKLLIQALALIRGQGTVRYAGITEEPAKLPQTIRKLFHKEVSISLPERAQRRDILEGLLSRFPQLAPLEGESLIDDDALRKQYCEKLGELTSGFVAADLVKMCQHAFMSSRAKNPSESPTPVVTMEDFVTSLPFVKPAHLSSPAASMDQTGSKGSWTDFGG